MNKNKAENLKVKRRFLVWAKEADGKKDNTVECYEQAIDRFLSFISKTNLKKCNLNTIIKFKKWFKGGKYSGNSITLVFYCTTLRHLKKFFSWLSSQRGYKSTITPDLIQYLNPTDEEKKLANQKKPINKPTLEYVIKLCESIKINNAIDLRDRAIIAFLLITGVRHKALITLPLGCLRIDKGVVDQDPLLGVETKFSKKIISFIFNFDDRLVKYIVEWVNYLISKGFGSQDPLFPCAKNNYSAESNCFENANDVEAKFWKHHERLRCVLKKRSSETGLPYFSPHTFRHATIELGLKHINTGEELKAFSQSMGHERITTTLTDYGNLTADQLIGVLQKVDFSEKSKK